MWKSNKDPKTGKFIVKPKIKVGLLKNTLSQIYYDPTHPASFSTPWVLYDAVKKILPDVTIDLVKLWLRKQASYTLHKETKTNFLRRKVLVRGPRHQYQADLLDMSSLKGYNNQSRYILTIIDCFSRLATAIPQRGKKANYTLEALKKGFEDLGGFPKKFQTDNGTEFYNSTVGSFLQDNDVIHFSTFQSDTKAQIVERFNRTLRNIISKYFVSNKTKRYLDILPSLLQGYNSRKHSAFKHQLSPLDIQQGDSMIVERAFKLQYGEYLKQLQDKYEFNIGDLVLLAKPKKSGADVFKKKTETFGPGKYMIMDRINTFPPVYKIKHIQTGNVKDGTFYGQQLQLVDTDSEAEQEQSDDSDTTTTTTTPTN